jgi:hypothetical protein
LKGEWGHGGRIRSIFKDAMKGVVNIVLHPRERKRRRYP